jgi:hypothetical protein
MRRVTTHHQRTQHSAECSGESEIYDSNAKKKGATDTRKQSGEFASRWAAARSRKHRRRSARGRDGGVWGATENHDRGRRSMRAHAPAHDAREHPLCETHDKHHTRDLTQQQSQGMLEPCVSMLNSERRCCSTGLQPAPCEPNARSQRVEKDTSGAASGL